MYRGNNTLTIILFSLFLVLTTAIPAPRRIFHPKTKTTSTGVPPTHVAPSTCQTYYPSVLRQIHEAQPDVMQANTANSTRSFHVAQSVSTADHVKFDRIHQHVVFDKIRPGSWDCQLMVSWPNSNPGNMVVSTSSRPGTSATSGVSLDVFSAHYNATAYDSLTRPKDAKLASPDDDSGPFSTWHGMMRATKLHDHSKKGHHKSVGDVDAKLTYFGTVAVNPGEYGMAINSGACPSSTAGDGNGKTLEFLFEMPSFDSRDASVSFSTKKEKSAGVYLLANC